MRKRRALGSFNRWRRSRGFGVHSTFAYRLITETLRCKDGYYEYRAIERLEPEVQPQLKMLLRLVCMLRPRMFRGLGTLSDTADNIIGNADSEIEVKSETPDMLFVSHEASYGIDDVLECVKRGGTVFFDSIDANLHAIEVLSHEMAHGMTFSNGKFFIAVGRRDLPRQHFEINF